MDNWTADALASGSVWILEKGERVVMPNTDAPEHKARVQAFMQALQEKHGVKLNG